MSRQDLQKVEINSRADLRAWLKKHHAQKESVWLVTHKKSDAVRYIPYDDIVEQALCFGWVDSLPRRLDAKKSMRLLSPRKAGSAWSAVNKKRIEQLMMTGEMHVAGLVKVEEAKRDGSWSRLDDVEALMVPDDLNAALCLVPEAAQNFEAFPRSAKRAILEWILQAKTAETRSKRIDQTAKLAGQNVRANQPRQPKGAKLPRVT